MQNLNLEIPTELEAAQLRPDQFLFISDGTHFGLYFNTGFEVVGVRQQDPNFEWTPEINFNLK